MKKGIIVLVLVFRIQAMDNSLSIHSKVRLSNVALPRALREEVNQFIATSKDAFAQKETPPRLILSGPPETGKRMLAQALAFELDLGYVTVSYSGGADTFLEKLYSHKEPLLVIIEGNCFLFFNTELLQQIKSTLKQHVVVLCTRREIRSLPRLCFPVTIFAFDLPGERERLYIVCYWMSSIGLSLQSMVYIANQLRGLSGYAIVNAIHSLFYQALQGKNSGLTWRMIQQKLDQVNRIQP